MPFQRTGFSEEALRSLPACILPCLGPVRCDETASNSRTGRPFHEPKDCSASEQCDLQDLWRIWKQSNPRLSGNEPRLSGRGRRVSMSIFVPKQCFAQASDG